MKHYIVYIPGLGDGYDKMRAFLLQFWRIYGVTVELVPMKWYDGKPYKDKYDRVKTAVNNAEALGFTVSVIGESAGGSMAMNIFARHSSLYRMVSLCGINTAQTPIASSIFRRGPAFKESVSSLAQSRADALQSRNDQITSITAAYDPTVPVKRNIIPGVRHITVWSIGHFTTIVLCLSLFSFIVVREIRRRV
jgi:hypothetical protein